MRVLSLLALGLFLAGCPGDKDTDTGPEGPADADGDGFSELEDCNDDDAAIYPGADEVCDGVDNNCDDEIDEASATDAGTWYADADGDGYGSSSSTSESCMPYDGYVADSTDCNDGDSSVNPGATEECDSIDHDCDGSSEGGGCELNIIVEGASGDIIVPVPCEPGEYSCQAQHVCNSLTGETCVHQEYDCATGTKGSWYPPSHGGDSNFNFAYAYDFWGSDYGNICDCIRVSASYGIGVAHEFCGTGPWFRQ